MGSASSSRKGATKEVDGAGAEADPAMTQPSASDVCARGVQDPSNPQRVASLPLLRKSKCASITNVCSVAATAGIPKRALYSATKGAVLSLTMAMANDHIVDGVRVNCVNPGTADTPWVQRLLAQAADPVAERKALEARQPLGRLVSSEEVASAICYLASPLQGSTTGTSLVVDGGMQGLRIPK